MVITESLKMTKKLKKRFITLLNYQKFIFTEYLLAIIKNNNNFLFYNRTGNHLHIKSVYMNTGNRTFL